MFSTNIYHFLQLIDSQRNAISMYVYFMSVTFITLITVAHPASFSWSTNKHHCPHSYLLCTWLLIPQMDVVTATRKVLTQQELEISNLGFENTQTKENIVS